MAEQRAEQKGRAERFLLELRHEAHRMLPPDHAEQVVMEAQWHLEESVYGGAIAGKSPDAAAREAIADFGPPRRFVRRVSDAAIDSRASRVARGVALFLTFFLLVGWPLTFIFETYRFIGDHYYQIGASALIGLAVASFIGRRAQTRLVLISGASMVAAMCLFLAVDSVRVLQDDYISTTSRLMLPDVIQRLHIHRDIVREEKALLALGIQEARQGGERIPAALNIGGALLCPKELPGGFASQAVEEMARHNSPFRPTSAQFAWEYSAAGLLLYARSLAERQPADYNTTKDIGAGWTAWRKYGNVWLKGQNQTLYELDRAIQKREDLLARPATVNWGNVGAAAKWLSLMLAVIVGANALAGTAGRLCVYRWRRWLWRLRTA